MPTSRGRELACQAPSNTTRPSPRRDPLRPLGWIAERFPPWFYDSQALRPARLRDASLHALRFLSAAPPLSPAPLTEPIWKVAGRRALPFSETSADHVIVGSGDCPEPGYRVDLAEGSLAVGLYPDRVLGVLSVHGLTAVHFRRITISTGSYERLPPIIGNDLPGVLGIGALEVYGAAGGLRPGTRIAVWAPRHQRDRAEACARRHALTIVWMDEQAPEAILGRRRVRAIAAAGRIDCELFVTAVRQPAIELALQGGATAELSTHGLPILAITGIPDWMQVTGSAAADTSGVPDVPAQDRAFACLCEDVRVGDLQACIRQGFSHPELIKRRTGAMTGPCQGKLCSASVLAVLREMGCAPAPIRARPLARPVSLRELAADA